MAACLAAPSSRMLRSTIVSSISASGTSLRSRSSPFTPTVGVPRGTGSTTKVPP